MPFPTGKLALGTLSIKQAGLTFCLAIVFGSVQASDSLPQVADPRSEASPDFKQTKELGFADTFEAALAFDPQLKRAYWVYQAEKEEEDLGLAGLLPSVNFSAVYQYEDSDNIFTDNGSGFFDPTQKRSLGAVEDNLWRVEIRQTLFNYSAYQDYQSGKSIAQASVYRYKRSEQELIFRVTERYVAVLLSARQVYLNQQKLEALNLKKTQAKRAHELGIGDQLEILFVKSNRDLARSDLLQAKSKLVDAQTLLSNLVGFEVKIPERWIASSNTINPELLAGSQEEWLQRVGDNFSVKEARARINQEKYNLASKKGEHYPKLELNLSYLDRKSDDFFRTRKDAVAMLEFSVPLYSGGRTQSNVRKARARLLASEAELDFTIAEKEQQIKLSYNRMVSFKERLIALAASRDSGKGYLEAAERQLSLNLSDQVKVLDARTTLVDTQLQITQTLNDYLLSDLILRLESGRLDKEQLREYDRLFDSVTITK